MTSLMIYNLFSKFETFYVDFFFKLSAKYRYLIFTYTISLSFYSC